MFNLLHLIQDQFSPHVLFSAAMLLLVGYLMGHLAERIKLPAITGYIVAGILVGHNVLNLIRPENMEMLYVISEITLSFIAVIIGGEFSLEKLKLYGKKIVILTLSQMLLTFFLVSFGMLLVGLPNYIAFVLGAISAATAPAATVVIVEKLKARGKFVDYLYGIVALDDAGTVILFSVAFAISASLMGAAGVAISSTVLHAFKEVIFSLVIGVLGGLATHYSTIKNRNMNEVKILALGFIFLSTAISIGLGLSPLIANMALGMVLVNMSKTNVRILFSFEPLTSPLYAIFFGIAGVELKLEIFADSSVLLAGFAFIILRALGKYFGVYFAAQGLRMDKRIRNYLGLSLLPQAGVAIGLVLFVQASPIMVNASEAVHLNISKMINIVLMSVFFNEIVGPPLSKLAIVKNLKRR
ncbi:MAG: cation:proton antiporter [Candidatus Cloacimonadaceae bacterium]|jgi:Kef-type K+ transport system membrane component KefB|nr:cation:proton antiporter [Candidatus Cloacimonadota bacterium]MDY0128069.1 cation:proton antiporter [Candidatus Cloacimonadaceae bacterium]MCB5255682.1 cation:proton antiporter [Candidatus Cloacimonadota bacterium]MCK9178503.1 cation:proton antiporter [Candidatus Cloacimonadota bacterium]MCK9242595.1 cation:proton antiporter [Candidatus Cloacimonadota bacterium]